jgi:hypothetical protein
MAKILSCLPMFCPYFDSLLLFEITFALAHEVLVAIKVR